MYKYLFFICALTISLANHHFLNAEEFKSTSYASAPYFPEGFGAKSKGGQGGEVYHVTSLKDSRRSPEKGTLRHAVESAKGPRTIIFDVSGTIKLTDTLRIDHPFITIDGSTSPNGITLRDYGIKISDTHDIIVRYLKVRMGDQSDSTQDCISVTTSKDVMIEKISAYWSIDELISVTHSKDVTVQWSILAESLSNSHHSHGEHGKAALITNNPGGVTYHHNLFVHNNSRNPRPGSSGKEGVVDFRNNLIYDYGKLAGYSGDASAGKPILQLNLVGNYYKKGKSTSKSLGSTVFRTNDITFIHASANLLENDPSTLNNQKKLISDKMGKIHLVNKAYPFAPVKTQSAKEAYELVLKYAGDDHARDAHDLRIIEHVQKGIGGLIDSQEDVGGW